MFAPKKFETPLGQICEFLRIFETPPTQIDPWARIFETPPDELVAGGDLKASPPIHDQVGFFYVKKTHPAGKSIFQNYILWSPVFFLI